MNKWLLAVTAIALALIGTSSLLAQGQADVTVTVLYDNYALEKGTKADWGFACLVSGTEKAVLFDTGTKAPILLENMRKLNVSPSETVLAVISHAHGDHTGGLMAVLEQNPKLSVYLPASCSKDFVGQVAGHAKKAVVVTKPVEICKNVHVIGPVGQEIVEQTLVIDTKKGLVILLGCSHPGVVEMVSRAKEQLKKDVYLVCGGMHLLKHSEADVKGIIARLKEMGVQKVGPTHCTGVKPIALFKEAFGGGFIQLGVGKTLKL